MKKNANLIKVSLLLLQVVLYLFLSSADSFANIADPGQQEAKLFAASNKQDSHLLFASGPVVPAVASVAKCNNFSGQGFHNKDFIYPGYSLTHSEKSFLKFSPKKSSISQKQNMRLHLACCVLLI